MIIRGRFKNPARWKSPALSSSHKTSRDSWEKADIIAKFFSSVVIAVIGLLITWSIQSTQIETNKAIAKAQLDAARLKAQDDRRLQESQITVQLLNHLTSKEPLEREVAVIALRRSVANPTYEAIVQALATSDSSEKVRIAAIKQLATSNSPQAAHALTSIVADGQKSIGERLLAARASEQVALSTALAAPTYIFAASNLTSTPLDSAELHGGVFTHWLIGGIKGAADANHDSIITAPELSSYINFETQTYTSGKQQPLFSLLGNSFRRNDNLFYLGGGHSNIVVVAVGISRYGTTNQQVRSLAFAASDARAFVEAIRPNAKAFYLLVDEGATRAGILTALRNAGAKADSNSMFIFYFAGHAVVREGRGGASWLTFDSDLSIDEIKMELAKSRAGTNCLFVDSLYVRSAFEPL